LVFCSRGRESEVVQNYVSLTVHSFQGFGTPFSGALPIPEEEQDEEDLDLRQYVGQIELILIEVEWGEEIGRAHV
jgi:hypothetical protein